ncbi:PhoX family phosphatase [Limnohabitans sp.]|uniref:PhoX family protein n=1 Tax=Limnohabitans sp. TaxID=1907725 RepID=UPI0035AE5B66
MDTEDLSVNLSENALFASVVNRAINRRGFLKMGSGLAATGFLAGPLAGCTSLGQGSPSLLGFKAVAASSADTVTVAEGYTARPFVPWGTPLFSTGPGSHWKGDGSETAADQARQVGENHDGMHFFPIDGRSSNEGLLVINHEYTSVVKGRYITLFGSPAAPANSLDRVNKAMNAWGCSVIHIRKDTGGQWAVVLDSTYNRRLTSASPMELTGPAAGDALLRTSADPTGRRVLGTINNCGNGFTPWGTYLTCEENFNNNFGTTVEPQVDGRSPAQKRYGITAGATEYGWETQHARFDYKKEPNESNRFGWVVEIDPFNPLSLPKKRTALGRFKHESAAWHFTPDKRVVVYMGDDQANDYVYKFVSDQPYVEGNPAANRQLLDSGKLYVARFDNGATRGDFMGTGEWLLLDKQANPLLRADPDFPNQAAVLVHARLAADKVGATKMDRPEWVAVHPDTGEVYCTMTNNAQRTTSDDANPREKNVYGQIVRWREAGGDAAATRFQWDLFVLAGNPTVPGHPGTPQAGSANVHADHTFNSPDGLAFDRFGRLWIQTDGNYSNTGHFAHQGNNQMLAADPKTREIRRFLVGPRECEVTGFAFTPDHRTMFVNIQHPGETGRGNSHWPDGGQALPRSATVIVTKNDGGVIGT